MSAKDYVKHPIGCILYRLVDISENVLQEATEFASVKDAIDQLTECLNHAGRKTGLVQAHTGGGVFVTVLEVNWR